MNTLAKLFILLLLLTVANTTQAQVFGGNPPSIKWDQVNTPEVKVIYPVGMDTMGRRVASIIHQMNAVIQPTIGFKQKQVSLLLQNQTIIPNAYVGLAPFRSEFYLTPDQNSFNIGSLNWIDQLSAHEYRHVQQYNNYNVGLSKDLHFLFGESGQALGNELAIPNWFFEGDAVYNETHVSEQGRGRIPYFFNGYRALWAAGKKYSYMKLRNGSYLDYTPDHYPLGYMLVSYGRDKYGNQFWRDVTHDAAAYKSLLNPFQNAFKQHAGIDFKTFSTDALGYFKKTFNDAPDKQHTPDQHFIADQEYPVYVNDNTIIYVKTTYKQRAMFVMKTGTTEKKIRTRDVSLDNYFAYHDGKIIYAAYQPDLRWGYRNYSELRLLDVNTGKERHLTHKTKYFAPDFSADGQKIVTVNAEPSGTCELLILSAADGKVLNTVPNPDKLFFTYPKFYGADKLVSATRGKDGKMSMAVIDIKTGKVKNLFPPNYNPVGFPVVKNDTIYFTATFGINDRLFALTSGNNLSLLNNDSLQHTIGNYQPAINDHQLAWVSFTAFGYQIHQTNLQSVKWMPVALMSVPGQLSTMGVNSLLMRDSATNLLAKVTDQNFTVTKYNKAHKLLNFHSLIPTFNDPNYTISLEGQNVLNTLQSNLLFNYNRDEGYKEFGFNTVYGALFPYLSASASYIADRKGFYHGSNVYWNETELSAGAEIPLTFNNGLQITGLNFGSDVVYNTTRFQAPYRALFADRAYTYLNNYVSLYNRITQAKQNIYPRFAQALSLNYKYAVTGVNANQFLASGTFYLPGFFINHNLVINAAFQEKNRNSVISFSNDFPFSRGYTAENLYRLEKIGANYHFPIAYPDAGVANTVYISRLRGNVFYDYTHGRDFYSSGNIFNADFRTIGAEVFFDTQWFNQVPLTFGIRYNHLLNDDIFGGYSRNSIEFIVPLTLF